MTIQLQVFVFLTLVISVSSAAESRICKEPVDVALALDASASIRESGDKNWQLLLDFVGGIAQRLPIHQNEVRLALVLYSTDVRVVLNLDESTDNLFLNETVYKLPYLNGNTNTYGALRAMRQYVFGSKGDRLDVRNMAVLITDGMSNLSPHKTFGEARSLRQNANLYTIGVTNMVNVAELNELSSIPTSHHHFLVDSFDRLSHVIDEFLTVLCTPALPTTKCEKARDIAIVVDSSGSIRHYQKENEPDNWDIVLEFIMSIVSGLDVGEEKTRVSLVRYADNASVIFHLNSFYSRDEILRTVKGLNYTNGSTNTSGAIRLAREEVFKPANGDRAHVDNVMIVMTDGESKIAKNETIPEAMKTRDAGIRILAVGLTSFKHEEELTEIASRPVQDHYFPSPTIGDAKRLVNRIVLHVCDSNDTRCGGRTAIWTKVERHLLVGHNMNRVTDIPTAEDCQRLCVNNASCNSIDFVKGVCALSHETRETQPQDFVEDFEADYYEIKCSEDKAVNHPPKQKNDDSNEDNGLSATHPPTKKSKKKNAASIQLASNLLLILSLSLSNL